MKEVISPDLGDRLKSLRERRGLNQTQASALTNGGLTSAALSKIEHRQRTANVQSLHALAVAYGIKFIIDASGVTIQEES